MTDRPSFLRVASDRGAVARPRVLWRCPACKKADRPSGPVIECYAEAYIEGGKIEPNARRLACLTCFANGILTLV